MKKSWRQRWRRRLVWALGIMAVLMVLAALAVGVMLKPYYEKAQTFHMEVVMDYPQVPYDSLPKHLVDAVVAAEDSRFFSHGGLDFRGIARAARANSRAQAKVQGGSTITQQLAKLVFDGQERTYERKLVEMFLARRLEKAYDKETILCTYLSIIYLGNGYSGIRTAARGYYGKDVSELSVSEAATLVGLIRAPSAYEPYDHPSRAKRARNLVLRRMVDESVLSREKAEALAKEPVRPTSEERI